MHINNQERAREKNLEDTGQVKATRHNGEDNTHSGLGTLQAELADSPTPSRNRTLPASPSKQWAGWSLIQPRPTQESGGCTPETGRGVGLHQGKPHSRGDLGCMESGNGVMRVWGSRDGSLAGLWGVPDPEGGGTWGRRSVGPEGGGGRRWGLWTSSGWPGWGLQGLESLAEVEGSEMQQVKEISEPERFRAWVQGQESDSQETPMRVEGQGSQEWTMASIWKSRLDGGLAGSQGLKGAGAPGRWGRASPQDSKGFRNGGCWVRGAGGFPGGRRGAGSQE